MPKQYLSIEPDSPAIQTHLSTIQSVIQRMAANSAACKAWCVTLVSAVLVIVADGKAPHHAWIALLPTFVFAMLDAYYLALEKGFRNSYNLFIRKIHRRELREEDLYSIAPSGNVFNLQLESLKSFPIWGLYTCLVAVICVMRWTVVP